MQTKFGHLHIPKSAGTSLGRSICAALGQKPVHVAKIVPAENAKEARPMDLVVGSEAFERTARLPFVSGHLNYSGLKQLDRSFIFTVLRDPRHRVLSLFSYEVSRAGMEKPLRNNPVLQKFAGLGFYDYVEARKVSNSIARMLLSDMPEPLVHRFRKVAHDDLLRHIDEGLERLDVVYACSLQEILDDLHARGFIPKSEEVWLNKSDNEKASFGEVRTRSELLRTLKEATELDVLLYERARKLFPKYVKNDLATDEELVRDVEKRYGVRFPD